MKSPPPLHARVQELLADLPPGRTCPLCGGSMVHERLAGYRCPRGCQPAPLPPRQPNQVLAQRLYEALRRAADTLHEQERVTLLGSLPSWEVLLAADRQALLDFAAQARDLVLAEVTNAKSRDQS